MIADPLSATESFLNLLLSCQFDNSDASATLSETLQQALHSDGFALYRIEDFNRNLRGHTQSGTNGSRDIALVMVAVCIVCAGLASGLTQGLLSLDGMEMKIKARSGTAEEKKHAAILIPIISNHHLLLVTLMLWNASATEALPIFLAELVPEYLAIIISVTLVLFVGEIIPASILTGPRQLQITAYLSPLVYLVLGVFFPIAYPISLCLDKIIGHTDITMYNRTEISTMMQLHREEGVKRASMIGGVPAMYEEEEVTIIAGALKYREMAVSEVMTPASEAYMISVHERLSHKVIYDIFKSGYSRIPVYEKDKNDVVGLILAKDLIFIDPKDETPVRNFVDLFGRKPGVVWHDSKLGETLSMFKAEKSHMAVVRDVENDGEGDPYYKMVGLITLEDIVEEILGTEIEDEFDLAGQKLEGMVRDPELFRLRTMPNATVLEDSLVDEEVQSIATHLLVSVPQLGRMFKNNALALQKLVRSSAVVTMTRKAPPGSAASQEDYLYRKGKMTNTCALILSGSVEVTTEEGGPASKDKVQKKGPWSALAAEALEAPEGTFVPSFSACIESETVRFLRISNFQAASLAGGGTGVLVTHSHSHHHSHHHQHHRQLAAKEAATGAAIQFNTITYTATPLRVRKKFSTTDNVPTNRNSGSTIGGKGTAGGASALQLPVTRKRGGSWSADTSSPTASPAASPKSSISPASGGSRKNLSPVDSINPLLGRSHPASSVSHKSSSSGSPGAVGGGNVPIAIEMTSRNRPGEDSSGQT